MQCAFTNAVQSMLVQAAFPIGNNTLSRNLCTWSTRIGVWSGADRYSNPPGGGREKDG